MATYKKGYKKRNTETILLKIIISIIITVFAFVAVAFVYDTTTQWKDYDNYTTITKYDGILQYKNGGDEPLDDYVVYFYYDTCSNCVKIKNDALNDGHKINKGTEQFFIANIKSMEDEDANMPGFLDSIGLTEAQFGTPALLVVVDGQFYDIYVGSTSVIDALDDIIDGNIPGFDD